MFPRLPLPLPRLVPASFWVSVPACSGGAFCAVLSHQVAAWFAVSALFSVLGLHGVDVDELLPPVVAFSSS